MANFALAQLKDIRVASPCPMQWDDMGGDGNVRFCRQCSLSVYNFSEMTPDEIGQVIDSRTENGRLCAGWLRRADGTMITRDCPVGVRLLGRKVRRATHRVAAAVGLLVMGSLALATPGRSNNAGRLRTYQPFAALCEWLSPTAPPPPVVPPPPMQWLAGDICIVPPNPNANGAPGSAPGLGANSES